MSTRLTFHLIPHTHWDREWYLPRAAFVARLVPLIQELLRQLESNPEARFVLDGQTVILEDVLAIHPALREAIAAQVQRGALEIGPWYVLADELIPSGESLLRNLLEGSRDAASFGRRLEVLYSPDAFGHPSILPTLARQFGIEHAVAWRGVGRPARRDFDLHRWTAPGGDQVVLYQLPPEGYSIGGGLATLAGEPLASEWTRIRAELAARAATPHIAVFLGADHHRAPEDLARVLATVQSFEPNHDVRLSGLQEYFAAVGPTVPSRSSELRGELRRIEQHTWVLQGVHGTRSRLKRVHSAVELELSRLVEPIAAMAEASGAPTQRELLRATWRALLQSQFHDTLGGCSADPVAREQQVRLAGVKAAAAEIAEQSWRALTGHQADRAQSDRAGTGPALFIWNPCARSRSGIATAETTFFRRDVLVGPPGARTGTEGEGYRPFMLVGSRGTRIPVQVLALRSDQERLDADRHYPDQDEVDRVFIAFDLPGIEGLGVERFTLRPSNRTPHTKSLEVKPGRLMNRWLDVTLSATGVITLVDRQTGERYPGLALLEDEPDRGDTYTFSRGRGRAARGGSPGATAVVASGPLIGAVETRWSLASAGGGDIECRLLAVLQADSPLLRLRLDIVNAAVDHRLRARFPVGAGEDALAGAAFGTELRGPVSRESSRGVIEQPVATAPAHRFVAAADQSRGLAILAPGFFEYEWTADQDFAITLLRSVGALSVGDLPERPGHAGWPQPTPEAQEPGLHVVYLAVTPVGEAVLTRPDLLQEMWEDAFLPLQTRFYRRYHGESPALPRFGLEGEGLVLSAVKPAEEGPGLVLRCCNLTASPTAGRWIASPPLSGAWLVQADEALPEELSLDEDGRAVRFAVGPHQLITLKVTLR